MTKPKLKVEIWSDVMCPFCYIGKRRFEKALAQLRFKDQIEVVWRSFQLNPNTVTNANVNVTEHLAKSKSWSMEYAREMSNHVSQMAAQEDLYFDFDKAILANSFNAHRLLQFAKTLDKGNALKEALLYAYFTDGKNTDDDQTLVNLAVKAGLPKEKSEQIISSKNLFAAEVHQDIQEAQKLRIQGVPFFVLDRKYGISGAQETQVFKQNLERAYQEWVATQEKTKLNTTQGQMCTPDGEC